MWKTLLMSISLKLENLFNLYQRMTLMTKLTLWGSVASIAGLLMTLLPLQAQSGNQTTNGNQSPASGVHNGDIIYENGTKNQYEGYALKGNGRVIIASKPDLIATSKAIMNKTDEVCEASSGIPVTLLGKSVDDGGITWRRVRVDAGKCNGMIGWVSADNMEYVK